MLFKGKDLQHLYPLKINSAHAVAVSNRQPARHANQESWHPWPQRRWSIRADYLVFHNVSGVEYSVDSGE